MIINISSLDWRELLGMTIARYIFILSENNRSLELEIQFSKELMNRMKRKILKWSYRERPEGTPINIDKNKYLFIQTN